ncbi:MAG: hypothetical protein HN778_01075 [Prolixibacteraceae bacterium]|jgi:hypothetical protein|nr:hypothetical protein [Prolixibacteraceae bacterium]MBT6004511.1 hypothetical protein [Prolixibacteraceae bacterium]MBT6765386.1 hypothetical protein [Prolixibacteraceae bacterium]MBT6998741.1 hypothetical protein [Prolixibacteraceae bacterium]MBT7393401.1 hypothetical protein [Prolixibacteraceae bacterium]
MKSKIAIIFLCLFTFLCTILTAQNESVSEQSNIKRNAVYYELFGNGLFAGSVNYDRLIPFNEKSGLILRGGLSWYEKIFPLGEINYLTGKQKHHFETGLGYTAFDEGHVVFIRAGYRFHGDKGLVIRAAPLYCVNESFLWFGISVGYQFN